MQNQMQSLLHHLLMKVDVLERCRGARPHAQPPPACAPLPIATLTQSCTTSLAHLPACSAEPPPILFKRYESKSCRQIEPVPASREEKRLLMGLFLHSLLLAEHRELLTLHHLHTPALPRLKPCKHTAQPAAQPSAQSAQPSAQGFCWRLEATGTGELTPCHAGCVLYSPGAGSQPSAVVASGRSRDVSPQG